MTDRQDFDRLLHRYSRLMASAVRRVCARRYQNLIPDVEQELRLALWKRLGSGNEIRHPASYLYKMALTTALALVEKQRPAGRVDEGAEIVEHLEETRSDVGGLLPAERRRLLTELLDQLGDEEADALRAYLSGFNHAEVAELFGWTPSVARHRIYRSIERLKRGAAATEGGADERRAIART